MKTIPILLAAAVTSLAAAPPPDDFATKLKPFLANNCLTCHSAALKTADIDLEKYPKTSDITGDPATWDKVVEMLKTNQMPPKGGRIRPKPM